MIICKPYKTAKPSDITQGFHPEHLAVDFASNFGTFLVAPFNCKIINIVGAEETSKLITGKPSWEIQRGNGVRMQSIEQPEVSIAYWHTLPVFPVKEGDIVQMGQPVGQLGNSGFVLSDGKLVPYELRNNPPYYGTHVHISFGTANSYWDYSQKIDWSIPVNYNLGFAIREVLNNILNFLR